MVMLILLPFRWKLLYHFEGVLHVSCYNMEQVRHYHH